MLFIWKFVEEGNNIDFNKLRLSCLTARAIFGNDHFYEILYVKNEKISFEQRYFSIIPSFNLIFNITEEDIDPIKYWEEQSRYVPSVLVQNDVLFKRSIDFDHYPCEIDDSGSKYIYLDRQPSSSNNSIRISSNIPDLRADYAGGDYYTIGFSR